MVNLLRNIGRYGGWLLFAWCGVSGGSGMKEFSGQ